MTAYWLRLGDVAPPQAWTTLEALADQVAGDPALPPVVPDDFFYAARVERSGLPELHVFRHVLTRGYLGVDDVGELWRFVGRGAGTEGYVQVESVADALARAGLERAESLALRTYRGPRRPDLVPSPDEGGERHDSGEGHAGLALVDADDDHTSRARTAAIVSASAAALSSR